MTSQLKLALALVALALAAVFLFPRNTGLPPEATAGFAKSPKGALFNDLLARVNQSELFNVRLESQANAEGLIRVTEGNVQLSGELLGPIGAISVHGTAASIDETGKLWSHSIGAESLIHATLRAA